MKKAIARCGSKLVKGYCPDPTCPFSSHRQDCPAGWGGHPEKKKQAGACSGKCKAPRLFYRTVIQVEVLSEEPFEYENLSQVNYAITEGECSGEYKTVEAEVISGKQAAKALQAQGSDPEFFRLDENGNDLED